jgi:hypothetical protein
MIQASFAFLETMESWISQQYNDLLGQGGTEKECWEYVCHCVREIFAYLHEARLPGRGILTPEERPVAILWGSLHPLLSHVLNLHLRQHSVRKVEHNALAAKVKMLEAELGLHCSMRYLNGGPDVRILHTRCAYNTHTGLFESSAVEFP